jgi:protein TonB
MRVRRCSMFEALPETRSQGSALGKSAVSSAFFAHSLAVAILVSASLLARVDPGADPPMPWFQPLLIELAPPLGTSPRSGGGGHPHADEKRALPSNPEKPREIEQPQETRSLTPEEPKPSETAVVPPDVTDPIPADQQGGEGTHPGLGEGPGPGDLPGIFGRPDGRDGGVGDVTGRPGPEDSEPKIIRTGIDPPVLLFRVEPEYPEMARNARVQGVVILEAVLGTDGRVESVKTLKSSPLLDAAARKAVQQWVYKPARQLGKPVKVYITIRVEFHLD